MDAAPLQPLVLDNESANVSATDSAIAESTQDTPLSNELQVLQQSIKDSQLPPELHLKLESLITRLNRSAGQAGYLNMFEEVTSYIEWTSALPWNKRNKDILDLRHAQDVLNKSHYGLLPIKERILEHLSVLILQSQANSSESVSRSPILCFVGLPGIGKTSIALSIAESMGRPFIRIPMGGMGTAQQLRGQSRSLPSAEPGQIIKSLRRVQVKIP